VTKFAVIVKRTGLFYDLYDNGPNDRTPASVFRKPWFLVEVKKNDTRLSPSLTHFQAQTKATHAFQVVMDLAYEPADCFLVKQPAVVPAKTLLSQLL